MKKILTTIFSLIIFSCGTAFAEGDLWDNYGDQHTYGQKAVSDKEFDKALESKTRKKKRNKNIPKGSEFHQSNETQFIKDAEEEMPVLCIPVKLQVGENIIPEGHYQIDGEKKDGDTFLNLYQAHFLIAKLPAKETQDDYGKETVHFVELMSVNDTQVKIIFGSIEFNAYSVIDIAQ